MRKWETLTALAAVVLASIGSIRQIPWHAALTGAAVVLILIVGISILIERLSRKTQPPSSFDAAERARKIRERRSKPR
jgi:hypothetical protein